MRDSAVSRGCPPLMLSTVGKNRLLPHPTKSTTVVGCWCLQWHLTCCFRDCVVPKRVNWPRSWNLLSNVAFQRWPNRWCEAVMFAWAGVLSLLYCTTSRYVGLKKLQVTKASSHVSKTSNGHCPISPACSALIEPLCAATLKFHSFDANRFLPCSFPSTVFVPTLLRTPLGDMNYHCPARMRERACSNCNEITYVLCLSALFASCNSGFVTWVDTIRCRSGHMICVLDRNMSVPHKGSSVLCRAICSHFKQQPASDNRQPVINIGSYGMITIPHLVAFFLFFFGTLHASKH